MDENARHPRSARVTAASSGRQWPVSAQFVSSMPSTSSLLTTVPEDGLPPHLTEFVWSLNQGCVMGRRADSLMTRTSFAGVLVGQTTPGNHFRTSLVYLKCLH